MHTIMKITMSDVMAANKAIKDGRLEKIFQKLNETASPQATFFFSECGYRAAICILDMKDASMIPSLAEPFFHELNAKVEFIPAMDASELSVGLNMWQTQLHVDKPVNTELS